jgi:hypothetical protein
MHNIETIEYKKPQLGKIQVGVRFKASFMADCLAANPPYSSIRARQIAYWWIYPRVLP